MSYHSDFSFVFPIMLVQYSFDFKVFKANVFFHGLEQIPSCYKTQQVIHLKGFCELSFDQCHCYRKDLTFAPVISMPFSSICLKTKQSDQFNSIFFSFFCSHGLVLFWQSYNGLLHFPLKVPDCFGFTVTSFKTPQWEWNAEFFTGLDYEDAYNCPKTPLESTVFEFLKRGAFTDNGGYPIEIAL